jgi:hypothetical protein
MLVGVIYGVMSLLCGPIAEKYGVAILVWPLSNEYAVAPISMLLTSGTMVGVSMVLGWEESFELRAMDETGWLSESRIQVQELLTDQKEQGRALPLVLGAIVVTIGIVLSFIVFW